MVVLPAAVSISSSSGLQAVVDDADDAASTEEGALRLLCGVETVSESLFSSSSRMASSWQMPSSVLVLELELLLTDFWLSSVLALTKLSELS